MIEQIEEVERRVARFVSALMVCGWDSDSICETRLRSSREGLK